MVHDTMRPSCLPKSLLNADLTATGFVDVTIISLVNVILPNKCSPPPPTHTHRSRHCAARGLVCEGEWDSLPWEDQLEKEMVQAHPQEQEHHTAVLQVSELALSTDHSLPPSFSSLAIRKLLQATKSWGRLGMRLHPGLGCSYSGPEMVLGYSEAYAVVPTTLVG